MPGVRRLLVLTCAIVLVDTIFYGALVPLIPSLSAEFGLSKPEVGVLTGAFGAGVLAGSIPGGYLTFRIGVKPTVLLGLGIFSLTSLAFGFAEGPISLVAARFGEGFGSALSWVAAFTWVVNRASGERRGEMIGILLSAAVVGALLGPVLGSAAAAFGIPITFSAMAALGAVIFLWAALEDAPDVDTRRPFLPMLRAVARPKFAGGLWLISLSPLVFGALTVLVPLELDGLGWGAAAIGAVFLAGAAFEAVAQPLIGRWTDRAGWRVPVRAGLLGSVAALLVFPWADNPLLLAPLVVFGAVAFNVSVTPGTALFSRGAEGVGVDQAVVFGATNLTWASGSALGPVLAGLLADLGGDALSYLFLAAVCSATLAAIVLRRPAIGKKP